MDEEDWESEDNQEENIDNIGQHPLQEAQNQQGLQEQFPLDHPFHPNNVAQNAEPPNGNFEHQNGGGPFDSTDSDNSTQSSTNDNPLNTTRALELKNQWAKHFELDQGCIVLNKPNLNPSSNSIFDKYHLSEQEKKRMQKFLRRSDAVKDLSEDTRMRIRCLLDSIRFDGPEYQLHFIKALNLELNFYFQSFRQSDPDPRYFIQPDYMDNYLETDHNPEEPWDLFSPTVNTTYHQLVQFMINDANKPAHIVRCEADRFEDPSSGIKTTWLGILRDSLFKQVKKIREENLWEEKFKIRSILTNDETNTYMEELDRYYKKEFDIPNGYFCSEYTWKEYVCSMCRLIWLVTYGFTDDPFGAFAKRNTYDSYAEEDEPVINDRFRDFYSMLTLNVLSDNSGLGDSALTSLSLALIQVFHSPDEDLLTQEEHHSLITSALTWLRKGVQQEKDQEKSNKPLSNLVSNLNSTSTTPNTSFYMPSAKRARLSDNPHLSSGININTHYTPSVCSSSRSSFREQQSWNLGNFDIMTLSGKTRETLMLRYLLFEVQVVDNAGIFVKNNFLSILIQILKKPVDGLQTFMVLVLMTELTEVQRMLNEICTKNVLNYALKVNAPTIATNGVVNLIHSLVFKTPEYFVKMLNDKDQDQVQLVTKCLKYLLWCVEKGYEEGKIEALEALYKLIETDKRIFDKFNEINGLTKVLNCVSVLKIVNTHCFSNDNSDASPSEQDLTRYDMIVGRIRIRRTFDLLMRYLGEDIRHQFFQKYRHLFMKSQHRMTGDREIMMHLNPLLINRELESWGLVDKILQSNMLPVILKVIYDSLYEGKGIEDRKLNIPGTDSMTDGLTAIGLLTLMTLSDTTRQELGKVYSFRSTSRDNIDSHEYHDVKFPGILLCLEYMKRCTGVIRQMQNKPKHSNDITSMLVCCFNVLYYATCPPIDLKSEIVHAPATVEDEYTEIELVDPISDFPTRPIGTFPSLNRSITLEGRIQIPTSSTSPNPIFSPTPLTTSSPYSRRPRNSNTLKLFNGQQIMVHYEQYQKGKSLKIPTKADHENKIYALWFLLRRADILQVLKKTMLDEKLLSIIEKAGESGQLSWSALTTTIIMTCVLIIHGMARWEPCRAILQQMGIIEHLQVIKFKNSRDLACKELNDSSDNEDNGNGKITEVFAGNNGPDRNERPNLNEKNGKKGENDKNDKNSEKEDKIKAKNRFENLKTQMVEEVDKLIDSLCNHQTDKDTQWKGISQSTALSQTNIRYNNKDVLLLIESHLRKVGCEQTAKQLMKERIWKKEFKPKNNKQDILFKSIVKRPEIKSKSTRSNKLNKHTNSTSNSTSHSTIYSPNTPNKQKGPVPQDNSTSQKQIKLKTSLASLLEKHVGREYAANRNHVTTSIPEYRFTKTKPLPKIGQKPIYTSNSRNVLSRIHNMKSRNMQSHHTQMRTYSKHEDQLIYNNYRPRQQMLAYGEGQPTAFHFLSNDVAIVGDSRGTISATKLPQETMEPECYQDSNTLLLANEMFDEVEDHEIYQITSSPISRKKSQPIGQSLDWGMMPPNFAITTRKYNNGGTYTRSAHIINTNALPERIYSFENVKWLEYSRDNEQHVLATVDRDLTHLDINLNHTCKLIDLSRDGRVVQEFGMKNSTMNSASLASFNLKCNKAVMQPRTNDKIILSAGVLYDARVNSTMRNSRGNEITKGMISFKLDVIDKHVTNGVFHPYKPEIVRDDCIWDVRYVSEFNNSYRLNDRQSYGGGRIIKNIPELKGSEVYFSETGSVMYSSKAWVSKYQNIMDPTFLTENTNCFTVFNSQTYEKVGFCPTKFPLYDLSFDDRNSHFCAIEKTGLLDSSDLDASTKYEMRFWQIGRRLRVKGEVGPYDFDQGEDYEEGGDDTGGMLDYGDDSDDDDSDMSDNDGGSDSDSSVDSRVESFSDSSMEYQDGDDNAADDDSDNDDHDENDENGENNDENDDYSVTESEIQAEIQNYFGDPPLNLPEEWENAISTPSDGVDSDGSDDDMSDDDGPPTNFPLPTEDDLHGMFEQVEREAAEREAAERSINSKDNNSDEWVDTDSNASSTAEQLESPKFTVENLLKIWKDTLDLKAIVFLKLESGSKLSFEQITQAMAIQIVLKKYPEIKWTTEEQNVYFAALTVLLRAFDKSLDLKDVPKTLEQLKRLASTVPEQK